MSRDKIRSRFLSTKKERAKKIVPFGDGDDVVEVEIRQPSAKQQVSIMERANVGFDSNGDMEMKPSALIDLQREAVFELCYVPGTDERVFEKSDREAVGNLFMDDEFFDLGKDAISMIGGRSVDDAEKN